MKKAIFWFAWMVLLAPVVRAQAKFYTELTDQHINANQAFQLQYVVEGAGDIQHFMVPSIPGFRILDAFDNSASAMADRQSGKMVNLYARVLVLVPKKSGRFVIPGATAVIDGRKRKSNAVNITVQPTATSSPAGAVNDIGNINIDQLSVIRPGESVDDKVKKNFFLKVEVNKTTCFVGEPLMAVYKLYTRLNASSEVVRRPSFTGFSVTEMVDAYDGRPDAEMVDGVPYYSILIRKVQLFPLQEGEFELDKAEIESMIHFYQQPDASQPSTSFFSGRLLEHHVDLATIPVRIIVKPLPEKQPEHYNGAVGSFDILLRAPRKAIHQGDLVKLQLVVTGHGNIPLITPPQVSWPRGIDTVEPMVTEQTNKYNFPLAGSKTFEYSFAARDTGTFSIPTIRFCYYNVEQHAYKSAETVPLDIRVLPVVTPVVDSKQATSTQEGGGGTSLPRQMYWFALVVLVIVGWICYQIWHLHKSKPVRQQVASPQEPSVPEQPVDPGPSASDLLARPSAALEQENSPQFYHDLQEVLWQLAAAKCDLLPLALNKHNIEVELRNKNVPGEVIDGFISVVKECEWALYTPGQSASDMRELLEKAKVVVTDLLALK